MGQQEVYSFLKENPGFWSTLEIAKRLGVSLNSVQTNCKKLKVMNDIHTKTGERGNTKYYMYSPKEVKK